MPSESKVSGSTIGMSFVVIMVGQATLLPALTPTYGMPFLTDSLIALTIPSL